MAQGTTGLGIHVAQIRTFVKIASMAREGEVRRVIGPPVLPCDNVLNVVREVTML